jgi:TolB-like protein
MRRTAWLLLWVVLPAWAGAAPPAGSTTAKPRLAVSPLSAEGVTPAEAAAMTDAVVQTLASRGLFQVMSQQDVQTILGAERQRQLLGTCGSDQQGCATNLAEALGATYALTGSLAKVGDAYQLSLQALDTVRGQPLGRGTRLARDLATLRLLVPYAAAEATGSPLPPPPSRVLQYGALVVGGGTFVAGGVLGMLALGSQSTLNSQLCPNGPPSTPTASCGGTNLQALSVYKQQNNSLGTQKSVALGMLIGGAAIAAAGLYFMPPPEGGPRIAVVPTPSGFSVAGTFP